MFETEKLNNLRVFARAASTFCSRLYTHFDSDPSSSLCSGREFMRFPRITIQIMILPSGQPETLFFQFVSTLCEASNREAEFLEGIGPHLVNRMKGRDPLRETETKQKHSR